MAWTRAANAPREPGSPRCDLCGARNPAGHPYCVECGARYEGTLPYGAVVHLALASAWWSGTCERGDAGTLLRASANDEARADDTERRAMDMAWMPTTGSTSASAAELAWDALAGEDITAVWSGGEAGVPEAIAPTPTTRLAVDPHPQIDDDEPPTDRRPVSVTTAVAIPPCAAVLVELAADGYPGQGTPSAVHFIGRGGSIDVGRACAGPGAGDPYLDDWHASLASHGEGLMLHEAGSRGGVWMRLSAPRWLQGGDRFRIGQQFLAFDAVDGVDDRGRHGGAERGRIQCVADARRVGIAIAICDTTVLGRAGTDVVLGDDPYVSVAHCRLAPIGDGVQLEDLGSSNGTWVRLRCGEVIPFGALVAIGRSTYRVESAER
ncbi:MAG: FHA domain-containing protein [Deltaproteobacteria bacterium]|nr:FHA domain-containing protein [Nannocystaceae bacterium]